MSHLKDLLNQFRGKGIIKAGELLLSPGILPYNLFMV